MTDPLVGFFDGACEPTNPGGLSTGGWVLPALGIEGCAAYCKGEESTNNVAEYSAAVDCLREVWRTGWRGPVLLHGDSQLVVRQFSGVYRCRSPRVMPLLEKLRHAATFFEVVQLVWVPRAQNTEADRMSKVGFERHAAAFGFRVEDFGKSKGA